MNFVFKPRKDCPQPDLRLSAHDGADSTRPRTCLSLQREAWSEFGGVMRKPLELPPEVARSFVKDMRAFFAEQRRIKREEIAGRQLRVLWEYQRPSEKKLRRIDVEEMFAAMRDFVGERS
jgi:hypothetical protein